MLESTKAGTIVELVSGRERPAAEMGSPFKTLESGSLCGLVSLVLGHEARQLFAQQCRNRTVAACCQHPRLADEIVVKRQRYVPLHRALQFHVFHVLHHFHVILG